MFMFNIFVLLSTVILLEQAKVFPQIYLTSLSLSSYFQNTINVYRVLTQGHTEFLFIKICSWP